MADSVSGDRIAHRPDNALPGLRSALAEAKRNAELAVRAYERRAWITYGAIFVPIPFAVLILRFHLEAWGYYVAGGSFVAALVLGYALDLAAVAKRDRTIEAAERAQQAYDEALRASRHAE